MTDSGQHTELPGSHAGDIAPWWSRGLVGGGLLAALAALVWVSALEVVDARPGSTQLAGASVEVAAPPAAPAASPSDRGAVSSRDAARTVATTAADVPTGTLPTQSSPTEAVAAAKLARMVRQRQAALSQIGDQAEQRTTELEEQRRAEALARKAAAEAALQARRAAEILAARTVLGGSATTGTTGAWVAPTSDYRITAEFGEGGALWSRDHTGLDFAAPSGTPVVAVTGATVTSAGTAGAYGNRVVLTHADGTETSYSHLSEIHAEVGATVVQGEMIGEVGSTGNSTGPHLHFEVVPVGGEPVDPTTALLEHGVEV